MKIKALVALLPVLLYVYVLSPYNVSAQTPTPALGEIKFILRRHDGTPLKNLNLELSTVVIDANGVALPGQTLYRSFSTGETGEARLSFPPGKYFITPDLYSGFHPYFLPFFYKDIGIIELKAQETREISRTLGRVDFVPRNEDGSLLRSGLVMVYKTKVDANGLPITPDWCRGVTRGDEGPCREVDYTTGLIGFNVPPDTYSVAYWKEGGFESRRSPTLLHDIKVNPGIRVLLSTLPDWDIPNGHYYTQTGANQGGFRVTNEGGVAFWDELQRLGGADFLGFPVSNRYFFEGTFMQAFQKAILKWDGRSGEAKFYPVLEQISLLVGDEWLSQRSVPDSVVFFATEDEALILLDSYPSIRTKFFANPSGDEKYPYWREHYGYPSGSDEYSAFIALRTSNAVFQLWKVDQPGVAKAGEVTLMNVGDLAKEAGIIPKEASIPGPPN